MISSFNLSPAIFKSLETTIPPKEITAISEVPPPISTIIEPTASCTGMRTPMAAAIGSSTKYTSRAPAFLAASSTARFSTSVTPDGIPITTRGRASTEKTFSCTLRIKYFNISSVTSKSDTTPATKGRVATICAGVRPTMRLASSPIATIWPVFWFIATTEGSFITMPRPRT